MSKGYGLPGHKNVKHHSLVESSRVLLPPLHIKLGLMKNSVNGTAFLYLRQKFPLLSDAKIREGVFTGPDIRSLLRDEVFERIITGDEQRAGHAFREVVRGFLGNTWCVQLLRSPKEAFAAAIQSWRERCEKCVCLQGDYIEKLLHFQLPVVSSFF